VLSLNGSVLQNSVHVRLRPNHLVHSRGSQSQISIDQGLQVLPLYAQHAHLLSCSTYHTGKTRHMPDSISQGQPLLQSGSAACMLACGVSHAYIYARPSSAHDSMALHVSGPLGLCCVS
jgi:hypothetical protein